MESFGQDDLDFCLLTDARDMFLNLLRPSVRLSAVWKAASIIGAFVAFAGAGCRAADRTVSAAAALSAARDAGFTGLAQSTIGETDFIYTKGYRNPVVMPLTITRLSNTSAADRRYQDDQPLLHGQLSGRDRLALPRTFRSSLLSEAKICNLVVSSYNARRDPLLASRFARLLKLLQKKCR